MISKRNHLIVLSFLVLIGLYIFKMNILASLNLIIFSTKTKQKLRMTMYINNVNHTSLTNDYAYL